MTYRIEGWSARGVATKEASTKREANEEAKLFRGDPACTQTVVIFPNGKVRVCRNTNTKVKA